MSDQPRPPAVTTAYLFGGVRALLLLVNLSGAVLSPDPPMRLGL